MYKLQFFLFKCLHLLFSIINISSAEKLANIFAFMIGNIFRYRREVILDNLHLVYGDILPEKENILLKKIYRNFTYLWFEVLYAKKINLENFKDHFTIKNFEIVNNLLSLNKGLIMITGHLGNFEWTPGLFGLKGYYYNAIAKRQRNPYINAFMQDTREYFGGKIIFTKNALKEGLRVLRNNEILMMVVDQDARRKGVFVNFLGIPSSTAVGTAIFHLRTKAPILFIAMIRKSFGHFDVYFEEVNTKDDLTITEESVIEITQAHSAVLEKWVRKYPEQWFWMHKRWKTKPKSVA